jgi:hypothetical protein
VSLMTSLEFVEKREYEDANKIKHWQYNCRHCNSVLFDVPLNLLAFIQEVENRSEQKPEEK